MAVTPAVFAGKMATLAASMPKLATVGTEAVAFEFKKVALAQAPSRIAGKKLNVVYKIFGANTPNVHAIVEAVPRGLWSMVESGTKPHMIYPRDRDGVWGQALKFPDGNFAASAPHPGTRGKHPWGKTKGIVLPNAGRIYQAMVHAEMAALF